MDANILDLEDVLTRVQDDKELLIELLDIFEDYFPDKRKMLDEFAEQGDAEKIKEVIHSIKGAAGNISAKSMHDTCVEIERLALENNIEAIKKCLVDLDKQFSSLKTCVVKLKKDFKV